MCACPKISPEYNSVQTPPPKSPSGVSINIGPTWVYIYIYACKKTCTLKILQSMSVQWTMETPRSPRITKKCRSLQTAEAGHHMEEEEALKVTMG